MDINFANSSPELRRNLARLQAIPAFYKSADYLIAKANGCKIKKISNKAIKTARAILLSLKEQPEVRPNDQGTIYLSYGDARYCLEITVSEKPRCKVYYERPRSDGEGGIETGYMPDALPEEISRIVDEFWIARSVP